MRAPGATAGGRDGGGGTCPPMTIDPPPGGACAAGTFTCLTGCGADGMCQNACLMADPDPNGCLQCLVGETLACATTMGCDDEWGSLFCCVQDNCPTVTEACITMSCGSSSDDVDNCVAATPCGNTMLCFGGGA